jgi:NEDD8-activating enzyme E1 regulatory subunit
MIARNPEFFQQFTMVIATSLNTSSSQLLSKTLWQFNIPLILVRSVGFIGSFRIVMRELTRIFQCNVFRLTLVVETHPEDVVDLRLDCPWPELANLASTLNFSEMDDFEHGHIPYILILLKSLEQWNATVFSQIPGRPIP